MGSLVFLQPLFLAGLAAVVVPLLIHLIQRKRKRRVAFPTLRFLMQTDRRSARRWRLVDMLVMLLRMALFALVALALAQPMLRPKGTGSALGLPSVAIVIDDSLSMQATAGGARLFDKALEAARHVLTDMPQDGEAFVLLTSGRQPRALAAPTSPPSSLIDALATLACSHGGRTLAGAVNEAVAALRQCKQPHKALIIIGDRQARALEDAGALDRAALEQAVHSVTYIDVSSGEGDNLGIQEASATPAVGLPGMPLRVRARVFNSGAEATSATVALWLDGEKSAERTVSLPAHGPGEVAFAPVMKAPGMVRAAIKLEPDALAADDTWYLPLRVLPTVRALIVTPPGASAGETLYLRLALSPAARAGGGPSPVIIQESDYLKAGAERLGDYGIIFVVSGLDLPAPLMRALDDFVARGGVLVCFPALSLLREKEPPRHAAFAIGPVRQPAAGEEAWGIESFEKTHPLFALLAARAPALMSDVSISAAVDLSGAEGGRSLASLPGGRPLLIEIENGRGRRFVWATGCHPDWGDLPLRPLFLPLVFEMLKTAAAGSAQALPTGNVDKGFTWEPPAGAGLSNVRVGTPGGAVVDARLERGGAKLVFDQAAEPGFYTIESVTGPGATETVLAGVNVAGEESDLRRAAEDELTRAFPPKAELRIVRDGTAAARRLDYATRGFAFAHWLLALAVAALLAATWLANSLIRPEEAEGSAERGARSAEKIGSDTAREKERTRPSASPGEEEA